MQQFLCEIMHRHRLAACLSCTFRLWNFGYCSTAWSNMINVLPLRDHFCTWTCSDLHDLDCFWRVTGCLCYSTFRKYFRDDGSCGRFLGVENQKHPWNGLASAIAICCHSSPVNSRFHRSVDCVVQENTVCKCQTPHPILKHMSCEIWHGKDRKET